MRWGINIRGLRKNSVGTSIKQLRIFLRDRIRRKLIKDIDLSDFKILEEEADTIYLNTTEIRSLYSVDLRYHTEWARFRDMFVLVSLTSFRFSDFNEIKPDDIRNGVLYKKQSRSEKWVVIPLRSEAHDILINNSACRVGKALCYVGVYKISAVGLPVINFSKFLIAGLHSGS